MKLSIRWRLGTWPQVVDAHEAHRCHLQRRLDEASAWAIRLTSTLEAQSARLEALTAHHQQELALERDEVARRLQVAQDALRWKAQLADLAVGVVRAMDACICEVAAQAARADETTAEAVPLGVQLERARRTACRARAFARPFVNFRRGQAQPPEPTDLNGLIFDLAPTLQQLVGRNQELLLRLESTAAPIALGHEQIRRLLISLAVRCGEAQPSDGQMVVETRNIETIPTWDVHAPYGEPLPFVRLSVTISGQVPQPIRLTPSIEWLMQEYHGHCDEVSTDDGWVGLSLYLPRLAGDEYKSEGPCESGEDSAAE